MGVMGGGRARLRAYLSSNSCSCLIVCSGGRSAHTTLRTRERCSFHNWHIMPTMSTSRKQFAIDSQWVGSEWVAVVWSFLLVCRTIYLSIVHDIQALRLQLPTYVTQHKHILCIRTLADTRFSTRGLLGFIVFGGWSIFVCAFVSVMCCLCLCGCSCLCTQSCAHLMLISPERWLPASCKYRDKLSVYYRMDRILCNCSEAEEEAHNTTVVQRWYSLLSLWNSIGK